MVKINHKIRSFLFFLAVAGAGVASCLSGASRVEASVIYSQPIVSVPNSVVFNSNNWTALSYGERIQTIATFTASTTATISYIRIKADYNSLSTAYGINMYVGTSTNIYLYACNGGIGYAEPNTNNISGATLFTNTNVTYLCTVPVIAGETYTVKAFTQSTDNLADFSYYGNGSQIGIQMVTNISDFVAESSGVTLVTPTAQTYLSNPITFSGQYDNLDTYNQIQFDVQNTDTQVQLNFAPLSLNLINGTALSWTTTRVLPYVGNYSVSVRMHDTINGSSTTWTTPVLFSLGTTTVATSTRNNAPLEAVCETFNLGCYLKQAFSWAFYPQEQTIDQFSTIDLSKKAPFIYAYEVGTLRNELFTASTTASGTVAVSVKSPAGSGTTTITFLSASMLENVPFAGKIKTLLTWFLWFMLVEYVYYRIIRVHDNATPA